MAKKLCNKCLKEKPTTAFYKFGRYYDSMCKECRRLLDRRKVEQRRKRGDLWYQEASGNKSPLPFDFSHRVTNSQWREVGPHYVKLVSAYERKLTRANNVKAARILQQHLENVPKHLPYDLSFTGEEWPIIARALCAVKEKHEALKRLYTQLLVSRRKAKYDYESKAQ